MLWPQALASGGAASIGCGGGGSGGDDERGRRWHGRRQCGRRRRGCGGGEIGEPLHELGNGEKYDVEPGDRGVGGGETGDGVVGGDETGGDGAGVAAVGWRRRSW